MAKGQTLSTLDIQEKLVSINSVSKTVKGGRIKRFTALMVVGDGNGHVGYGLWQNKRSSQSNTPGESRNAKKNLIKVFP